MNTEPREGTGVISCRYESRPGIMLTSPEVASIAGAEGRRKEGDGVNTLSLPI